MKVFLKWLEDMSHSLADITGHQCTSCNVGKAHVQYYVKKKHFYFGCSASTKEKPCRGPKEWQRIDVPHELRVLPAWAVELAEKKITKAKQEKKSVRADPPPEPDGDALSSSKKVKKENESA